MLQTCAARGTVLLLYVLVGHRLPVLFFLLARRAKAGVRMTQPL